MTNIRAHFSRDPWEKHKVFVFMIGFLVSIRSIWGNNREYIQ